MKKAMKRIVAVVVTAMMVVGFAQAMGPLEARADTWAAPDFDITSSSSTYDGFTFKFTNENNNSTNSILITNNLSSTVGIKVTAGYGYCDSYTTVDPAYSKFKGGFSDSSHTELSASDWNYWSTTIEEGESVSFEMVVGYLNSSAYANCTFYIEMVSQDTCSHTWEDGVCTTCGKECSHVKDTSTGYRKSFTSTTHVMVYDCKICGMSNAVTESGTHSGFSSTGESYGSTQHMVACETCGYEKAVDCTFTKTTYTKINGNCHYKNKQCTGCSNIKSKKVQSHTVKGKKCKYCKAKVIKPGATKIKSVKKGKSTKTKTHVDGHWAGTSWISATTSTAYHYPITVKIKKAKNAKKYIISLKKPSKKLTSLSGLKTSKKTTIKWKNPTMGVKFKKLTLYVTPVSKTGTYGKTVKKVVKVKQP
ncbi:MAG: hypothetical protein K6G01_03375 [Eubacterium sp.]|nr:hypothetical protein [Eubacterium sp.]